MSKLSLTFTFLLVMLILAVQPATVLGETNFSQREGFAQWRQQQRSQSRIANVSEQALLHKHRPIFMLHRQHPGLIDFYRDYIANGELHLGNGELISAPIDAETLNSHSGDPEAVFVHQPPAKAITPAVVYARSDPLWIDTNGARQAFKVLTWHAVFRQSGLPLGLQGAPAWLASLAGDVNDWHQLDHYTAVSLLLDAADQPLAMMLQQHNYLRTYLLGESVQLSREGRPLIDVALRSNELFPHRDGAHKRRAVRFTDADGMRYLMGFAKQPLMAADDFTQGEVMAEYRLGFLLSDDAFYLFEGYLGEQRLLPGRDGPPGAGYNTMPAMKPLQLQWFSGYWRENSAADLQRFEQFAVDGNSRQAFAEAQREVFFQNLQCLRDTTRVCR